MGLPRLRTIVAASSTCLLSLLCYTPAASAQGAAAGAPAKTSCKIRKTPLTEAEAAFSRREYGAAFDLFSRMTGEESTLGKAGAIRSLIEENKVAEAKTQALAWIAQAPTEAAPVEALAEVMLREGDVNGAYQKAKEATDRSVCEAQSYVLFATVETMSANYALARRHILLAHRLDAIDPRIRFLWIGTLSGKERAEAYREILADGRLLNPKRKEQLTGYLERSAEPARSQCSVTGAVDTATIPIRPILDGPSHVSGLALDVFFNGKRRRLEIDTGASGLTLSRGAAFGLGLVREQKVAIQGVGDNGQVDTSTAHVDSLKIGTMEFHNCEVEILEKRSALEIDGLIGADVFRRYLVTLDYPKLELRLDPLPKRPNEAQAEKPALSTGTEEVADGAAATPKPEVPAVVYDRYIAPEMKDWTQVYRVGHELLIPVIMANKKLNMFSGQKLFLVDTGAGSMLVSPAAAREVTKVHGDDSIGIHGLSGAVKKTYSTDSFTYGFAHLRQEVQDMTSIDTTTLSNHSGVEISGFLGIPVLSRLTVHIDYRDNLMKFEFDPKHDQAGSSR